MEPLPKPEVILTHESDLDGLVAGLVLQRLAQHLFNELVPLQAFHYHHWKMRELREKSAWVSDLSFESRLDRQDWVIFDHHPVECAPGKARLVHDLKKSAGTIVFETAKAFGMNAPELERIVHLNNVADLFIENSPDFVEASDYASLVKTYGFWPLHTIIEGRPEKLLGHPLLEVMQVKRKIEDPIGYQYSSQNFTSLSSEVAYVETLIGNNNLIVHQLLDRGVIPHPVLLTIFKRPTGALIVSLRSRNGEALKIAEKLQGGGHPNACGATLPRSVKTTEEALNYLRMILNPNPPAAAPLNPLEDLLAGVKI